MLCCWLSQLKTKPAGLPLELTEQLRGAYHSGLAVLQSAACTAKHFCSEAAESTAPAPPPPWAESADSKPSLLDFIRSKLTECVLPLVPLHVLQIR